MEILAFSLLATYLKLILLLEVPVCLHWTNDNECKVSPQTILIHLKSSEAILKGFRN